MPSGKRTWTTFAESWLKQMKSDHCFVLIVNEKQMKHGRSCNSQMWLISFENVTLGLHPHVTFSTWCLLYLNVALTTVHHLYNDEHHVTASWPISAAAHSWSYDSIERWTCHGWMDVKWFALQWCTVTWLCIVSSKPNWLFVSLSCVTTVLIIKEVH